MKKSKKSMKRILAMILVFTMTAMMFSGCTSEFPARNDFASNIY